MSDLSDALARIPQDGDDRERIGGFLWATVTAVDDSTGLYRVKARLMSQDANADTHWMPPLLPGGIEARPEQGETVAVFFCDGDPNRGAYLYSPTSKTKQRPSEAMVLGTTFIRIFNGLVSAVNQIRSDVYTAVTGFKDLYNTHTHIETGGTTNAPGALFLWSGTDPGASVKGKAGDGSTPDDLSTSSIVLSKHGRVK